MPKNHEALGNEILDYLSKHPEAEDSLEGIVEWWLVEQGITHPATEVRAALEQLVARKQISGRQGPDGRTHCLAYRRQSRGIERRKAKSRRPK